jgi:hypothetical protein
MSIYQVHISKFLGSPEYIGMADDAFRLVVIQGSIQLMLVLMDPAKYQMFSADFAVLLMFVIIGCLFYWLVFKKIVTFV